MSSREEIIRANFEKRVSRTPELQKIRESTDEGFRRRVQGDPDCMVFATLTREIKDGLISYEDAIRFFEDRLKKRDEFKVYYNAHK